MTTCIKANTRPPRSFSSSFTGQVKLHAILVRGSDTAASPQTLKVFANRTDVLDFETAGELAPTQTLELARTNEVQELPVRRALFAKCQRLALFFEEQRFVELFPDSNGLVMRACYDEVAKAAGGERPDFALVALQLLNVLKLHDHVST